jgi:hypothetical protein
MIFLPVPSTTQITSLVVSDNSTLAQELVHVLDDFARTEPNEDLSPQVGTHLVYKISGSAPKVEKWSNDEDAKFRKLAAAVALKKNISVDQKREFLLLQKRRRSIKLRVSAEQRVWDLRDREFRTKARAALEDYFEFLGSPG